MQRLTMLRTLDKTLTVFVPSDIVKSIYCPFMYSKVSNYCIPLRHSQCKISSWQWLPKCSRAHIKLSPSRSVDLGSVFPIRSHGQWAPDPRSALLRFIQFFTCNYLSSPPFQVAKILKKQESERTQEESADLLLHQDTVQELCSRQVRRNVLKRKQEEVCLTCL